MRENRTHGSEGGEALAFSTPIGELTRCDFVGRYSKSPTSVRPPCDPFRAPKLAKDLSESSTTDLRARSGFAEFVAQLAGPLFGGLHGFDK